jgi:drug/metabolite transporter (DMT)-like permease
MRIFLLTALTMIAFAANSLLNRLAVDSGAIDASTFAFVRVLAGAVMLGGLARVGRRAVPLWSRRRVIGAGALTTYLIGFSLAYMTLNAGLGALILFGVVQIAMFSVSALRGTPATARQLAGAGVAFGGLVWVLWPGADASTDLAGAALMALAGLGWAAYTLAGRSEPDALAATAANFLLAVPLVLIVPLTLGTLGDARPSGLVLAIVSGAVTSGLGYALWYSILPRIDSALAATVQLSVPVIALAGGFVFLDEAVSMRFALGTLAVLGGIALTLRAPAAVQK